MWFKNDERSCPVGKARCAGVVLGGNTASKGEN